MQSAWGPLILLGHAPMADAPAAWADSGRLRVAWQGVDMRGPQQFMQVISTAEQTSPEALTLPVMAPHTQMLLPAANGHSHLLWLDLNTGAAAAPGLYLWSAVVTPDLLIERGPLAVSDQGAYRYSAVPGGDLSVWLVWSSGLLAEPDLMLTRLDAIGRPRLPERLVRGGDWPALLDMGSARMLLWQRSADSSLMLGMLDGVHLVTSHRLTTWPHLEPGDRLAGFRAGADVTHLYAFWNIVRAGGRAETWWASGTTEGSSWSAPARLQITMLTDTSFETGFNGGAAQMVQPGELPVGWSAPMAGVFDVLAIAAQVEDSLGVLYLQGGQVRAFQSVVRLNPPGLIGSPALHVDQNRHLSLLWGQPANDQEAALYLASTQLR